MTESSQHARISQYINDIIAACRQDPARIEVAIANFKSLLTAMKLYDQAPRYFNAIFSDNETIPGLTNQQQMPPQADTGNDLQNRPTVATDLEKIYGKKLKITELQQLGNILSQNLNIKLDRDTKRSKVALLSWFAKSWSVIYPKIYELGLQRMIFRK